MRNEKTMTLIKFKANKTDKYKGIYKRVFKILNNGWYENAFQGDESIIVNGYWNLYVEDDDCNPKEIDWESLEELKKIKGLEILLQTITI